jgi:hypothetical protein
VQVPQDGHGPAELLAVAADSDVETSSEHDVGAPEGDAGDADRGEGDRGVPQRATPDQQRVEALGREHEDAVGVRRDGRENRHGPEGPRAPIAAVERAQEQQVREGAREQEQAVHPPVDAMEEQHPAGRRDRRGRERGRSVGQARAEERHQRNARDREHRGEKPQRDEAAATVGDDRREQEMERRAAPLAEHGVEESADGRASDEQRERLVLVGGPRRQLREQERRDGGGAGGDAEAEVPAAWAGRCAQDAARRATESLTPRPFRRPQSRARCGDVRVARIHEARKPLDGGAGEAISAICIARDADLRSSGYARAPSEMTAPARSSSDRRS